MDHKGPQLSGQAREQTPRKIKVCHLITRLSLGGAQENTLLSVEGLMRTPQYEVELVLGSDDGSEGELVTRAKSHGVHLLVVPEMMRSINPLNDLLALRKVTRLFQERRYHIVHTHMSKAGILGRLAARRANTPVVVHSIHGLAFHDYQPWLINQFYIALERWMARSTDHFISVSQLIADKALAAGIGAPEKFTTIYSGMELDWFLDAQVDAAAVRAEWGIPADALVVGKIARLFPLKGHEQLLPAIPAVVQAAPDVRFLFIGDGVLQEKLKAQARQMGVADRIVFAGLVPRERIPEMVGAMDVLVHTSLREGLARVLVQALAMGKPCVSFNLDGAPEVVVSGETGYLVEPNDTAALADALIRLLQNQGDRLRMGARGRRLVDPRFRAETMVAEIAALYQRLLTQKGIPSPTPPRSEMASSLPTP